MLSTSVGRVNVNVTVGSSTLQEDPYPFDDFAPTLSQCFAIVVVGYLLARFELLSTTDVKGVNAIASYFAIPGIICASLAEASFDDFRWELLVGIFIGKLLIFLLVAGFLLYIDGNWGVAGIVAIFCVHSNDLPVGNPLMSSLYKVCRPQMTKYLFLIPAMTVIFFVPAGNMMVHVHRTRRRIENSQGNSLSNDVELTQSLKKEVVSNLYGIVKQPTVVATALGLTLNFAFKGKVPKILYKPIKVTAATTPGIALSILGFSFIRKERFLISSAIVPSTLILVLKLVLTPILLHTIMKLFIDESESSKFLSDFALLYGIISPATVVFQLGQEFREPLSAMSVALILSSFTCFFVSYVVARFTIVPTEKMSSYCIHLRTAHFWSAGIGACCDVIAWIMIILKKQWRQVPYHYVMCLVFSQFLTNFGVLFYPFTNNKTWTSYFRIAFSYGGEILLYLYVGSLASVLIFKDKYSLLTRNGFYVVFFMSFSFAAFATMVICLLMPLNNMQKESGNACSKLQYLEVITITILLFVCLLVLLISITVHLKQNKRKGFASIAAYVEERKQIPNERNECRISLRSSGNVQMPTKLDEVEESQMHYEEHRKDNCFRKSPTTGDREWFRRIRNLLLLQSTVFLVRFIANIYTLANSTAWEIRLPLEYLQTVLFSGQGFIFLLTFGIDVRTVVINVRKRWRKLKHGDDVVDSSNLISRDPTGEVALFCDKFNAFYYSRCFKALAKDRKWKVTYKDSFWGHQLVDWLISEGLNQDDTEAEAFGQKLLMGGVIKHVADRYNFYNASYLYYFTKKQPSITQS